jgi:hypothetical protein
MMAVSTVQASNIIGFVLSVPSASVLYKEQTKPRYLHGVICSIVSQYINTVTLPCVSFSHKFYGVVLNVPPYIVHPALI